MTSHAAGAVIHPSHHHRSASFLAVAGIFTVACIGVIEPLPSTTGAIMITVSTAGASIDLDADGYALTIDSQPPQGVGINASISFGSLVRGEHVVRLDGLSPNCSVTGGKGVSRTRWVTALEPCARGNITSRCAPIPSHL